MYLQKISIVELHVGTLEATPLLTVRTCATDSDAWNLGHELWDTWLRRNPGRLTRLVVGRRRTTQDD